MTLCGLVWAATTGKTESSPLECLARARVFSLLALDLRAGKVTLCCVALRRVRVPRVLAACWPRVVSCEREDTREGASVSEQVLNVLIE